MRRFFGFIVCLAIVGCSLNDIIGDPEINGEDPNKLNPDAVKSYEGAIAFYRGVLIAETRAFTLYADESAVITDERRPRFFLGITTTTASMLDARRLSLVEPTSISFESLQSLRANARQGRGILTEYAPAASTALRAHLYAIEAMADVLLADLFCSGVPLSTVNYDGSFTLRNGSTTEDVYRTAIELFDSASILASDSARIRDFAAIGKARVLLALGESENARRVVDGIVTSYRYNMLLRFVPSEAGDQISYVVSDREGGTGLPYASSGDPRSAVDTLAHNEPYRFPLYVPRKVLIDGNVPFTLASGIEARLIEAEADVRANGTAWLQILNELRATEIVPALTPLTDPALEPLPVGKTVLAARLDRILAERGYWLFLTGHRQGDLRRFVRTDRRPQQTLYPSGAYPSGGTYGPAVNAVVPVEEQQRNSKYTGCINREP